MSFFSDKCDECGSKDHATEDCPHDILSYKCDKCGSKNHATEDCPHDILSYKCDECGSKDHATEDCPHDILSYKCDECGSKNHATDDCPHGMFSSSNVPESIQGDVGGGNKTAASEDKATSRCKESKNNSSAVGQSYSRQQESSSGAGWILAIVFIILFVWITLNLNITNFDSSDTEEQAAIKQLRKKPKLLSQTEPMATKITIKKETIANIQRELSSLNCTPGVVDGVFGPSTSRALVRFREANQFDKIRSHGESYNEILQFVRRQPRSSCVNLSFMKVTPKNKQPRNFEQTLEHSLRYLDPEGCLREPDGSAVIGFKPDECI